MKNPARLSLWLALAMIAGCGGGGGGGGDPLPQPVPPQGPVITAVGALPAALLGVPMNPQPFSATGAAPITWAISGGSPAPGLSLSADGVLSGTPTAAGEFTFTLQATDLNGVDTENVAHVVTTTVKELESNDTFGTANSVDPGMSASGVITAGDVDYWALDLAAGTLIRTELFAIRREHGAWDSNFNRPQVSIVGPNGADFLAGHDNAGWAWGDHDLDIPMFSVPSTGTYFVRIGASLGNVHGGAYVLKVSTLSAPSQAESEENDTAATATPIVPGRIQAAREDGDDDYYAFDISEPTLVSFEITGYRNGVFGFGGAPDDDYFAPEIELIDTDQATRIAFNRGAYFNDPALHYHVVTPGTYYLRVTESINGSAGDGEYYLDFAAASAAGAIAEAEPNNATGTATAISYGEIVTGACSSGADADFYSFSGTAGDLIRVTWFDQGSSQAATDLVGFSLHSAAGPVEAAVGTSSGTSLNCLRAILPSTGTFYVRVLPQAAATSYGFRLAPFKDAAFESEPNNTGLTANPIPPAGRVAGAINSAADADVFSFTALTDDIVTFSIYAGPGASSNGFSSFAGVTSPAAALLPNLEVFDGNGNTLGVTPYSGITFSGESVTNGLATLELTFVAPASGTYFVRVTSSDGTGDDDHRYLLELR